MFKMKKIKERIFYIDNSFKNVSKISFGNKIRMLPEKDFVRKEKKEMTKGEILHQKRTKHLLTTQQGSEVRWVKFFIFMLK